jgi:hypothetical protein
MRSLLSGRSFRSQPFDPQVFVSDRRGDFPGRIEFLPALREDGGTGRQRRDKVTRGMMTMFQVAQ